VGVKVGVLVGVEVGVRVGVLVGVAEGVKDGEPVGVDVKVGVKGETPVCVAVEVPVFIREGGAVSEGIAEVGSVGLMMGVEVGLGSGAIGVDVAVEEGVCDRVEMSEGVNVGDKAGVDVKDGDAVEVPMFTGEGGVVSEGTAEVGSVGDKAGVDV